MFTGIEYDKILLLGYFNVEANEKPMEEFCLVNNFEHLIKRPTCFKNIENPSCIDFILTNSPKSFQNTCTIDTGLSDFHHMVITVLKTSFKKQSPKIITYRDYKSFSNEVFRNELLNELSRYDILKISFDEFSDVNTKILDKIAPTKQRYVRSNQMPFMNKNITKSIMTRSRLKNNFLKDRSERNRIAYNRQRNYCVNLIRKEKKKYFDNLDVNKVVDNKNFWKTIKTHFSDKVGNSDKISLIDDNVIITDDLTIAETFSEYFSSVVKNLQIPINEEILFNAEEIEDPLQKAILTYKNHPSIHAIISKNMNTNNFSFKEKN